MTFASDRYLGARELREMLSQPATLARLVRDILPNAVLISGYYRVGNIDGEEGQSLGITADGPYCGRWRDYAGDDDHRGDPLDLIRLTQGLPNPIAAMDWARRWLGLTSDAARKAMVRRPAAAPSSGAAGSGGPKDAEMRRFAMRIWNKTSAAPGTPAGHYLAGRGITLMLPTTVRYHRNLLHKNSSTTRPALVARVQSAEGHFLGVWRIWLQQHPETGQWIKARVEPNKMGLGPVRGGFCLLHHVPDSPKVIVTEGLENGLSVRERWRTGDSVKGSIIATLSASLMKAVILPPQWTDVVIFPDRDPAHVRQNFSSFVPGTDAGGALGVRLLQEGRKALVAKLPDYVRPSDANEALMAMSGRDDAPGLPGLAATDDPALV